MAKKIQWKIEKKDDRFLLVLQQDAFKNDYADINQIFKEYLVFDDQSFNDAFINHDNNTILQRKAGIVKKDHILIQHIVENDATYKNLKKKLDEAKINYDKELFDLQNKWNTEKLKLTKEHSEKLNDAKENIRITYDIKNQKLLDTQKELEKKLASLEQNFELSVQAKTAAIQNVLLQKFNQDLKSELKVLQEQLNTKENQIYKKYQEQVQFVKQEASTQQQKLEQEIEKLNAILQKTQSLNVKQIGNELENWCMVEANKYLIGENETFERAKIDSENLIDDFTYKVFSSNERKEQILHVRLEAKNETLTSPETKNANDKTAKLVSYYKKLNNSVKRSNADYGVLISNLDATHEYNFFIPREYPNIIVVRPVMFVSILIFLREFAIKKYRLVQEMQKVKLEFGKKSKIMEKFDEIKTTFLNKDLTSINTQLTIIKKQAEILRKSADTIDESTNKITHTYLEKLQSKIKKLEILIQKLPE